MFELSPRVKDLKQQIESFMDEHIYPNEKLFYEQVKQNKWGAPPIQEELKAKAKSMGLWNLFLPHSERGAGLNNEEYGHLCEIMGRSSIAPEVFNCSAPDTGNMETIERYGNEEQKEQWLKPLLAGEIRSCFSMTEPDVASSDATNIQCEIRREGDEYVINGTKWWSSGAMADSCKIAIVMGKSNPDAPKHLQQSMILVPLDTPGVTIVRDLHVFGYDHAPHGHAEIKYENVRVPVSNMLLGEGRGFEIAQGRLGPGRIHHCMRSIGVAERALEAMCRRAAVRVAFGKPLRNRPGAPADHHGRTQHGPVRQQGCAPTDRHDQGRCADHAVQRARPRDPGPRRRRRMPGHLPRVGLRQGPHPAPGRRPGRSAPGYHCQAGNEPVSVNQLQAASRG